MFGSDVESAARAHALSEHPKESGGIVVGNRYVPIVNIAEDPVADFEMPVETWLAHGDVQGVVHSHGPKFALAPSANDMRHQIASNVPWAITRVDGTAASELLWWGDHRLNDDLIGRTFVHGVTDCYGAIRSWVWQNRGIKLPDFARNDQWWTDDKDLYNEGFPKAGYHAIAESEAIVGDVCLINFRSKVPNHGGILVEGGLLYHHLQNRLSCREPIGRWRPMITKWLRHEG